MALERAVAAVRRRANAALILERVTVGFLYGAFLYGIAVLPLRIFVPAAGPWVLAGLAGAVIWVVAGLALVSRRESYSLAEAAAWLDVSMGGRGRVLTAFAFPEEARRLGKTAPCSVPRFRPTWYLARLVPAAAFAALALLLPVPERVEELWTPQANPIAAAEIRSIEERMEELARDGTVGQEALAALEQDLERIRAANDRDPFAEQGLESIDALGERVDQVAREGASVARRTEEALAQLENALAGGAGDEELASRAGELESALADASEQGGLDGAPEALKEALSLADKGNAEKYAKLPKDPAALQKALQDLKSHCEGTWKQGLTIDRTKPGAGGDQGEDPGRGGVDRGPGPAALVLGERSPELAQALALEPLPPGTPTHLDEAELVGVAWSVPRVDPSGSRAGGVAGDLGSGPGGAVWPGSLGIRERKVVARYFGDE